MRTKANRARLVVAVFTLAVFYASVCSTTCAIGVCPNQVQQIASHDCDQMPGHHAGQSGHKAPESPDCSKHQHPNLLFTKSGEIAKVQLSTLEHLSAVMAAISKIDLAAILIHTEASDLAPPLALGVPLYQHISVLRI